MPDNFQYQASGLESPASFAAAVTPSDGTDLATIPRALFAATGGTVQVTMAGNGATVTLPILAGTPLPLRVTRIWATGTTASGIVGVW